MPVLCILRAFDKVAPSGFDTIWFCYIFIIPKISLHFSDDISKIFLSIYIQAILLLAPLFIDGICSFTIKWNSVSLVNLGWIKSFLPFLNCIMKANFLWAHECNKRFSNFQSLLWKDLFQLAEKYIRNFYWSNVELCNQDNLS